MHLSRIVSLHSRNNSDSISTLGSKSDSLDQMAVHPGQKISLVQMVFI